MNSGEWEMDGAFIVRIYWSVFLKLCGNLWMGQCFCTEVGIKLELSLLDNGLVGNRDMGGKLIK